MHYDEIPSTNDLAWNLISNNTPNKNVVILADNQTHGKGQYGRQWQASADKNITMTVMTSPQGLHIKDAFHLNIITSLSICHAIEKQTGLSLSLKWPNDIYHSGKKLCGILIKNKVINNYIVHSVLGIGVNVNQNNFDPDIPNPTSLRIILNKELDKKNLISQILEHLSDTFEAVINEGISKSCEEYNRKLYKKEEVALFKVNNEQMQLSIQKVLPSGIIQLKKSNGTIIAVSSGLEYIL